MNFGKNKCYNEYKNKELLFWKFFPGSNDFLFECFQLEIITFSKCSEKF